MVIEAPLLYPNNSVIPVMEDGEFFAQSRFDPHQTEQRRRSNEKLRRSLKEEMILQVARLLKKLESNAFYLLKQKDLEIAKEAKKRAELEEIVAKLEAENQALKRISQEKEAMIDSLNDTIEEMREQAYYGLNNGGGGVVVVDDAESCCGENTGNFKDVEEGRSNNGEEEEEFDEVMSCKSCYCGKSCYMFLPCRHLSACKFCEPFLKVCPVCRTPKKASIEALIF
ncbi:putative BOI-related E3 ubiquitin-protein ligase 3 [Senna tora]|uniref:Putative BOI-related E3 ubiquitin-protein ligase 3 n=1 Tax=Senna tora TaxID=362788 RepID=A0A834XAC7_9FABA|nr:putative BOI-related E3 ubiquitin-protein ligase 3 [Senna tora]